MVRPSQSGWVVDNGNVAFLSGGYDKGVVIEGVVRAVKKAALSSSPPSSESPPGGRGNREAAAPEGAVSRDGGGRGGRRSPATATDADAHCLDSNGPSSSSSCQGWRGGSREGYSFSAILYTARKRKKR